MLPTMELGLIGTASAPLLSGAGSRVFWVLHPIAVDGQFQDNRVVNQPVDSRRRGHRVLEDSLPLGKREISG